jgi:flavin reductase (DIM6/NTAB) family NADH-FMN oxidoreductase RutF
MNFDALFKVNCGMYIVSAKHGEKLNGQIVNAIVQVTADPVQLAISLNKVNLTCEMLKDRCSTFVVCLLEKDTPMKLIGQFGFKSGREMDKFEGVNYRLGKNGAPIVLDNTIGYLEAETVSKHDCGTHMLFIAKVTEAELLKEGEPMTYLYYREVKKGLTQKNAATYHKPEPPK